MRFVIGGSGKYITVNNLSCVITWKKDIDILPKKKREGERSFTVYCLFSLVRKRSSNLSNPLSNFRSSLFNYSLCCSNRSSNCALRTLMSSSKSSPGEALCVRRDVALSVRCGVVLPLFFLLKEMTLFEV